MTPEVAYTAIPESMRQYMLQRINSDEADHLTPEEKEIFKKEVSAFSHQVKKEYPKDDALARPLVVGYQLKHEETIIDKYKDKTLDGWKITIVFVTPKPVTPLSIDPNNEKTWEGAITEEVKNDPTRLHTVLGRCITVPQLMKLGHNVTVYAFYPESGFLKREPAHQEIYKSFRDREDINFFDEPMKYITDLKPEEVGAIYVMQPPGTFKVSTTVNSGLGNPLQIIEDELSELQTENNEQDLKSQVFITNIGAGQAIDASRPNTFSLRSGPLSNPETHESFNLRKNTIASGTTAASEPAKSSSEN